MPSSGRKERTLPLLRKSRCQHTATPSRTLLKIEKGNIQAIQRNAIVQRHDSIPAVASPIGLIAEAYAANVALLEGSGGCGCCEEESGGGGEEGVHSCCYGS